MYGDLGGLPLSVFRKLRMIKYWIRIVEDYDSNSLVCKTYNNYDESRSNSGQSKCKL